eukprot:TRINITY_DN2150_c0_g2_i1.p4 TRINITY_DN2150_c0_g2~~TRINITY_DN2150_c0_g2_i1.p4  ORF type:complete len:56 (-),score=10.12 TRINITY_DN2150_c0_g2_i1:225-392(-)
MLSLHEDGKKAGAGYKVLGLGKVEGRAQLGRRGAEVDGIAEVDVRVRVLEVDAAR